MQKRRSKFTTEHTESTECFEPQRHRGTETQSVSIFICVIPSEGIAAFCDAGVEEPALSLPK